MATVHVYEQVFAVHVLQPDGEIAEVIFVSTICPESAEGFVRAMGKGAFGFETVPVDAFEAAELQRVIHRVICADRANEDTSPFHADISPPNNP